MVLFKYMESLENDEHNFSSNTPVRSITYQKFDLGIVYITNEVHHIRRHCTLITIIVSISVFVTSFICVMTAVFLSISKLV
jgi:hypothetical protein